MYFRVLWAALRSVAASILNLIYPDRLPKSLSVFIPKARLVKEDKSRENHIQPAHRECKREGG